MFNFEKYFRVEVNRVVDGDTLDVSFYLGLGIWLNTQRVRLLGINTPETRGVERPMGLKVKNYLADAINRATEVIIKTDEGEKGKYGRFLVVVYVKLDGKWINVNKELTRQGAAVEYMAADVSEVKQVFDPSDQDIESRLKVDEKKTELEVYDEGSEDSSPEDVSVLARELLTIAREFAFEDERGNMKERT
jgi:micrococcal nuclease